MKRYDKIDVRPVEKPNYKRWSVIANIIISALITFLMFDGGFWRCDNVIQVIVVALMCMGYLTWGLEKISRLIAGDWR